VEKVMLTALINSIRDEKFVPFASRRYASRWRPNRIAGIVLIASWVLFATPCSRAQQPKASEFRVKAAYLYNFGKFVEWPDRNAAEKDQSFEICVLGSDPFGPTLDAALASGSIGGKSVAAKRISKPQDVNSCRILFISSSEEGHLKEVLTALDKASVLTVSDIPRFSQRGGMIGFILDGNRVRFDVNLASAQSARLTLSSELLKVATNVRKDSDRGDF
jgi:hypothetical protein